MSRRSARGMHLLARIALVLFAATIDGPTEAGPTNPASQPRPVSAADSVETFVATAGELYLGGTLMTPPYALSYYGTSLVVNGFHLPIPEEPKIVVSDTMRAQADLLDRVDSLGRSKLALGWPDSVITELMRREFASSPLVKEVVVFKSALDLTFASGLRIMQLIPIRAPGPKPDPLEQARLRARELKEALDRGCLIMIINDGWTLTVPASRRAEVDRIIEKVCEGSALSNSESELVGPTEQEQLRKPTPLVRVPEEANSADSTGTNGPEHENRRRNRDGEG